MTHRLDVARRRDVLARWCALAEQRLEFLTELFESGRWRRYHSEMSFLENIQEAKAAVETWRNLTRGEAAQNASPTGVTWPAPVRASEPPPDDEPSKIVLRLHRQVREPAAEPLHEISAGEGAELKPMEQPASSPAAAERVVELTLEVDGIQARYPLLRNVF